MTEPSTELRAISQPETAFHGAIEWWWQSKEKNTGAVSSQQGGSRDSNLRGDTMDGFRDKLIQVLVDDAKVDPADIFTGNQFSLRASNLPSFFRASKNWDVIVCKHSLSRQLKSGKYAGTERLVAAIEFKSQLKSIGNNQNNRIEESIGNAEDFWASYENGNFSRLTPRPWLGYLFVGYYAEGDETTPVEVNQPLIPTDPAFAPQEKRLLATKVKGHSYAERYRVFLERMLARKKYDGACFLVTHEAIRAKPANYRILFPQLSGEGFLDGLVRYVKAYYPD